MPIQEETIEQVNLATSKYKYGFSTDLEVDKAPKGLDENIIKSIKCKYVHEGEIFIGADLTMWPCCFLYDSKFNETLEVCPQH